MAVSSIIMSKTFDNGMICASEQSVVVEDPVYDQVKAEFIARGCHFVTGKDRKKLAETIVVNGKLNSGIVGQSAMKIAEMAGIKVPAGTKILIAEASEVNDEEVFAREKLSPVLAFYRAKDFNHAVELARDLILYGGAGHTSALYTDEHGESAGRKLPELFQCILDDKRHADMIQEVYLHNDETFSEWRKVRQIPQVDYFFENQWKKYRDREHIQ